MRYSYGQITGKQECIEQLFQKLEGGWFRKGYTLDELFLKVQSILRIFPLTGTEFNIVVVKNKAILKSFFGGLPAGRAAFMRKETMTMYVAADSASPKVIAHEFAHIIFEYGLKNSISSAMHEVCAQWVERQI